MTAQWAQKGSRGIETNDFVRRPTEEIIAKDAYFHFQYKNFILIDGL